MRVGSGFSVPWVILPLGPAILVLWYIVSIENVCETRELIMVILVRLDFELGMIWLGQAQPLPGGRFRPQGVSKF